MRRLVSPLILNGCLGLSPLPGQGGGDSDSLTFSTASLWHVVSMCGGNERDD